MSEILTLFTTSWTIKCNDVPDYLETGDYFKDLIQEFFELEMERHPDYKEEVWVFTITYPAHQGMDFSLRIMEFCADIMKNYE